MAIDSTFSKTPTIAQITLPGGSEPYYIKDAEAREKIAALAGYSNFLGVTTTDLVDGVTASAEITVGGKTVTAENGSIVVKGDGEYIYNGSVWQKFGDLSSLKALAYKDSASATGVTFNGTIPAATLTGSATDFSAAGATSGVAVTPFNYQPAGTIAGVSENAQNLN